MPVQGFKTSPKAGPTVLDTIREGPFVVNDGIPSAVASEELAHAGPPVHDAFKSFKGPLVVNDADPAGIEPTWVPSCNSAYRFKDGAKERASHFKTTPGPN